MDDVVLRWRSIGLCVGVKIKQHDQVSPLLSELNEREAVIDQTLHN